MPVPIFLNNEKAEPQYETIEKDELTEKDTIIETIVEPAKTEEKENENGEKETVETEPAKEKYKILRIYTRSCRRRGLPEFQKISDGMA